MKASFFPKTKNGWLAVILFILLVILVCCFFIIINRFGQRGGDTFFSNLSLTIPMLLAWLSGFLSFVLGLLSIFRDHSYSVLVILISLVALLTTIYGIMAVL